MHTLTWASPDEPVTPGLGALNVSFVSEGSTLVATLSGEVDMANAEALPPAVLAVADAHTHVRIDIAEVTFLDSSLLRALLICQARLAAAGGELKVRNASPQAQRIFEVTNLGSLLE